MNFNERMADIEKLKKDPNYELLWYRHGNWLVEQAKYFEQFKLQFENFQRKYEEFQKNWEEYDSERKDPFFKGYRPKQYFNLD